MGITIGGNQAKALLEKGMAEAEALVKDPPKMDELLVSMENYLKEVPVIGETLSDIPLMVAMIKAYITGKYKDVSPKVIACLAGSVIYLVKKKDLVPDSLPVIGIADDIAVVALALKISEPELKAFAAWRDGQCCCEKEDSECCCSGKDNAPCTAKDRYDLWMSSLADGDPLKAELAAVADDEKEINDRFYQEIVFGTAGLRGICGAGTNRMNALTVGRATQGIANYILQSGADPLKGLAVAYDCRYFSKEFSELVASIMAGNGIRCYLFPEMRPTPELSFAIRRLGCISGVNMTASHNPKEYNGYKVYWSDGAQISGEISDGMLAEIQKLDFFDEFKKMPLDEAREKGLVVMIGEEMDRAYLDYVEGMSQHPDEQLDKSVSIVYTPLNGAGAIPVRQVLTEMGYTNFHIVPEQEMPDPEFTTVGYPNPEDPRGFELSEKLGKEVGAEVLIATDPDSDRMAIEVPGEDGEYHFLNGNQTGALLIAYMAQGLTESGKMPANPALIKSIVTGDMGATIAESYGIRVFQALTGFKNICGKIHDVNAQGYSYFFGYEESIGCAPGEAVRDKDGVCCAMLIAEMAAYYKKQGMTIPDALEKLYQKYGYFSEDQVSLVREGAEGAALIGRIMDAFREGKPQSFGPFKVLKTTDYINGYEDIPASNVLRFDLGDRTWFAMRPSGTEPKIKFYYYAVAATKAESAARVVAMKAAVDELIKEVK